MATDLQLLQQARTALLTVLATSAGKPNYSIDGQSVSWGELMDRLDKLDAAIGGAEGPWEVTSQGVT